MKAMSREHGRQAPGLRAHRPRGGGWFVTGTDTEIGKR